MRTFKWTRQRTSHSQKPAMPFGDSFWQQVYEQGHVRETCQEVQNPRLPMVKEPRAICSKPPKYTVRADLKAKRLQFHWLSTAAPLTAGLQDIEDSKCDLQDAAKAMQAALLFLGNASQHHAVQCRQAALQQLNPQLKSLIKDDDLRMLHYSCLESILPWWKKNVLK